MLVLVTSVRSKDSDEPAHSCSLVSLCFSHTYSKEIEEGSDQKLDL